MKNLVSPHQLAAYLGISINTVYSWVNQRKVPYIKLGHLVRFDLVEIELWLKDKKVEVYS